MSLPDVVSHEEWLAARVKLLADEKALTRQHDKVNADRRRLPMVRVDKEYVFEGPEGKVTLAELFGDRQQLIVQHVMFGADWDAPCPSCSQCIQQMTPLLFEGLRNRETTLVLASQAPYAKIAAAKAERGWDVPWYSAYGSDFNYDFNVSFDSSRGGQSSYNYSTEPQGDGELPGASCFLRAGDDVYHTYSTYGRGMEYVANGFTYIDFTALGRQESWEEPQGRAGIQHAATGSLGG
jgi:predicted dithiol-disulfide oxidoreductase (DUF899 family)